MEQQLFLTLLEKTTVVNLLGTIVLLLAVIAIRFVAINAILRAKNLSVETRRRWSVNLRKTLLIFWVSGVLFIWGPEIRGLALSLAAVAVAVVIALKELILCVTGSFLRTLSRSFSIGDRIEVNGVRGDVIDQTLLTTTVLEIGPGTLSHQQTGRAITLPNKIFLECNVVNESYTDDFVLHTIVVSLYRLEDWKLAESLLLKIAGEETAGYMEDARKYFTMMGVKRGVELPSLEPRVILSFPDHKSVNLMLRACVPARAKGRVEQKMVRKFLDSFPIDRDALHD
ncbi:MAG: mechanosensitive ion channel family protein [Bdellovibrionaceae bacterium]|nr:mechanosensitive ion channel family protein [Bdellovibrionales bacterium]MCB9255124.1 mechanosensitive ion channel family protein [Pseudobdellovibrionaceae bacterium]